MVKVRAGLLLVLAIAFSFGCGQGPRPSEPRNGSQRSSATPIYFHGFTEIQMEDALSRAYQSILWREGDAQGLHSYENLITTNPWSGWLLTLRTLAQSEEFFSTVHPTRSNDEILDRIYEHLLGPGRVVDAGGRAIYGPMLEEGRYGEVVEAIGGSEEFFQKLYSRYPVGGGWTPTPTPMPTVTPTPFPTATPQPTPTATPTPQPTPSPTPFPTTTPTPSPTPTPVPQASSSYQLLYEQPAAWFPQLSEDGRYVAYGFGAVGVRDLALGVTHDFSALGRGFTPNWIGPATLTFTIERSNTEMDRYEVSTSNWTPVKTNDDPTLVAGNRFLARNGHWLSARLALPFRIALDNRKMLETNLHYGIALDMDRFATSSHTGDRIYKFNFAGQLLAEYPAVIPLHLFTMTNDHIAYGGYGRVHGIDPSGADHDLTLTPWGWEGVDQIISVNGQLWVIGTTWDERRQKSFILIRPWREGQAILLDVPAVTAHVAVSGGSFIVTCNDERGYMRVLSVPIATPRHALIP